MSVFSCVYVLPGSMCVARFYGHPRVAGTPVSLHVPTSPPVGMSGNLLHTLPCVCGPRALCACAPRAPLRSACVWVPACARSRPRVPRAGPGSCVLTPRGHPRVCPGAPGGRPRDTRGRRRTHRPARRGEEGGGGGGGERGHVTETDRRAGGRRRPRVRAGAGAPRPPPPALGLGPPPPPPRPAPKPPKCNFPCRRLDSGGFSGLVWKAEGQRGGGPKRGERGRRAGGGAARGEGARRGGAAAGPGCGPLAHLLAARGPAPRPLRPGPPLLRRLEKGGGEDPAASLRLAFPEKGSREGQTPQRGQALKSPGLGRRGVGGGRAEMPPRGGDAGWGAWGPRSTGRPTPDHGEAAGPGGGELCSWGRRAGGGLGYPGLGEAPARRARSERHPRPSSRACGPARALRRSISAGAWPGPGCGRGPGAAATMPAGAPAPSAGSPPACHYRRRLQGIYWGQGLLTGTRPPKLAIEGKMVQNPTAGGALLKRQDPFTGTSPWRAC